MTLTDECTNLVRYLENIKKAYWPDWGNRIRDKSQAWAIWTTRLRNKLIKIVRTLSFPSKLALEKTSFTIAWLIVTLFLRALMELNLKFCDWFLAVLETLRVDFAFKMIEINKIFILLDIS